MAFILIFKSPKYSDKSYYGIFNHADYKTSLLA